MAGNFKIVVLKKSGREQEHFYNSLTVAKAACRMMWGEEIEKIDIMEKQGKDWVKRLSYGLANGGENGK